MTIKEENVIYGSIGNAISATWDIVGNIETRKIIYATIISVAATEALGVICHLTTNAPNNTICNAIKSIDKEAVKI